MEKQLSYESELKFWQDNLDHEEEHLNKLLKFSKGIVHSGIMDSKRKIENFKNKIKELEDGQI